MRPPLSLPLLLLSRPDRGLMSLSFRFLLREQLIDMPPEPIQGHLPYPLI
jgi:hypothetical protein